MMTLLALCTGKKGSGYYRSGLSDSGRHCAIDFSRSLISMLARLDVKNLVDKTTILIDGRDNPRAALYIGHP